MSVSTSPSPRQGSGSVPALRSPNPRRPAGALNELYRARILVAMADVACEEGVEHASVARVIARAGVSRRTFYELFLNGQDCLLAVFDDALGRARTRIQAAYALEGSWVSRVRNSVLALLTLFDEAPDLARLCMLRLHTDEPALCARRKHVLETLAGALEEGRFELADSRQPPPMAGEAAAGAGLSLLCTALMDRRPALREELLGPLMAVLLLPYRGPALARRELSRPVAKARPAPPRPAAAESPLPPGMRITYRTARVLSVIATDAGASNTVVAAESGIRDQGQVSKLLARLSAFGLIESLTAESGVHAWQLTSEGETLCRALAIAVPARDGLS